MKRKPRTTKGPSKLDELTQSVHKNHAHLSTYEIMCRHAAVLSELDNAEKVIARLSTELAEAKAARARSQASLQGLDLAISRR